MEVCLRFHRCLRMRNFQGSTCLPVKQPANALAGRTVPMYYFSRTRNNREGMFISNISLFISRERIIVDSSRPDMMELTGGNVRQ